MNASIWKIPRILRPKKARSRSQTDPYKQVNTYLRHAVIGPGMIGQIVQVHNGHRFIPVRVTEHYVGFRFGQFARTKKRVFHKQKKNK